MDNAPKIYTCWCLCDTSTWVTNITNDKREGCNFQPLTLWVWCWGWRGVKVLWLSGFGKVVLVEMRGEEGIRWDQGSQSHVLEWGRGSSTTSLGWWLTPAIGSGREQQGVGAAPLWENCVIHLVHNCVQSFWSELYPVSCVHLLRSRVHCNRCDRQPCVKLLSSEVFFVLCTLQLCETVVI